MTNNITNDIPDTMLIQTKVSRTDKPNEYFAATLQNTYYRIRIHYLKKDYQKHKSNKKYAISINTGLSCTTIFENEIDDYIESIKITKATIRQ